MKAILKFDLDNKDDQYELTRCRKSLDMALAINEFQQLLRSKIKYGEEDFIKLEDIRDDFNEILSSYFLNIDELIY